MRVSLILVGLACLAIVFAPGAVAEEPSEDGGECVYTSLSGSGVSARVDWEKCKSSGGTWSE